jgi:hypothetical protein
MHICCKETEIYTLNYMFISVQCKHFINKTHNILCMSVMKKYQLQKKCKIVYSSISDRAHSFFHCCLIHVEQIGHITDIQHQCNVQFIPSEPVSMNPINKWHWTAYVKFCVYDTISFVFVPAGDILNHVITYPATLSSPYIIHTGILNLYIFHLKIPLMS